MATTTKGLPYPVGTDRVSEGDNAIAALATALDYTNAQRLSNTATTAASPLSAYPDGFSTILLGGAEATAGGWPDGASCQVWTLKQNNDRAAQWWFKNNTSTPEIRYRTFSAGSVSPWQFISNAVASGIATVTVTASATGSTVVTLPAGRFSAAPVIVTNPENATVFISGVSVVSASSFTINLRYYISGSTTTSTVTVHWIAR